MKVCVFGIWHLGAVTAACVARHFETAAFEPEPSTREALRAGRGPISEPGLDEAIRAGLDSERLTVPDRLAEAVAGASVVWVTFDTPVAEGDRADPEFVVERIRELFSLLDDGAIVLSSSQLPVGTLSRAQAEFDRVAGGRRVSFCVSPENLRLGSAMKVFREADRIVAGVRGDRDREILGRLFAPFTGNVLWMSPESAEMTKHALNSFLAVSVAFANEVATICERVGADAADVARGLRSDVRIGPKAYLGPGAAFAGGTLARDLVFLRAIAEERGLSSRLVSGALESNSEHRGWPRRTLERELGGVAGRRVALLGLTYKPGTDTLRRSESVVLGEWLVANGATVVAFDPAIRELPAELRSMVLAGSAGEALRGADAVVVGTEWPAFRDLSADEMASALRTPLVVDANRFLGGTLASDARFRYRTVGRPEGAR